MAVDGIREVTRRAELAERAEAALAHAGAIAQLGAWWIDVADENDLNASPLCWSDETYRIFGYEPREILVTNELFFEHVAPDDRQRVVDSVAAALRSDGRYSIEHRIVRGDGVERTVLERAEAQRDETGRLVRIVGVVQDITARKRAEAELRETEERFRHLANNMAQLAWMADGSGSIHWYNARWFDYTGTTLEDMKGWGWQKVHHPDHVARVVERLRHAFETGEPWEDTFPLRRHDGEYRWFLSHAIPIRNASGEVVRWFGTNTDVTAQRRAEDALRASELRLHALVSASSDAVFRMSADWSEMTQLSRRNVIAGSDAPVASWMERYIPEDERPRIAAVIREAIRTASVFHLEHRILREDGAIGWAVSRAVPLVDDAGAITEWFGMATDVTERRRAQEELLAMNEQLREADRRKTEFLAMLSHELRNPLAPICNSVYVLERAAPGSEQATRARGVVRRQAEHLTRLVDDLLDITRISHGKIPLERSRVDLREIVRRTTDDLRSVFAQAGITLGVDDTFGPVWVEADSTRIAQVLANLLNNSSKFTPSGGTVRVGVAGSEGWAELCVSDDGIGMDPKRIEHMFEPFTQASQSLARSKGGLGLGLALVKSIVELHGGSVTARSEGPRRGSEFLVRLPLAAAGAQSERGRSLDGRTASRTIAVVDGPGSHGSSP